MAEIFLELKFKIMHGTHTSYWLCSCKIPGAVSRVPLGTHNTFTYSTNEHNLLFGFLNKVYMLISRQYQVNLAFATTQ